MLSDMRKGVIMQSLTAEIFIDRGNLCFQQRLFSPIHLLKLKYYGTFIYITQIVHSNAHVDPRNVSVEGSELFSCLPLLASVKQRP